MHQPYDMRLGSAPFSHSEGGRPGPPRPIDDGRPGFTRSTSLLLSPTDGPSQMTFRDDSLTRQGHAFMRRFDVIAFVENPDA